GLQTAGGMVGDETKMINDQRRGWNAVDGKSMKIKVKHKVKQADGSETVEEYDLPIEVEVNSFNFGVNAVAFGIAGVAPKGWENEKNDKPMKALIGGDSDRGRGGQVGAWLLDARQRLQQAGQTPLAAELQQEIDIVETLAKDVFEMWTSKQYQFAGSAPYK